jgi:hypothetical protein
MHAGHATAAASRVRWVLCPVAGVAASIDSTLIWMFVGLCGLVASSAGSRGYSMTMLVASCTLAAYRQDEDCADTGHAAIKRHIALWSSPDHQFALAASDGPANQRTVGQDLYCLYDLANPRGCILDLEPGYVVEKAIKVQAIA